MELRQRRRQMSGARGGNFDYLHHEYFKIGGEKTMRKLLSDQGILR
jgi:hypothetical protein